MHSQDGNAPKLPRFDQRRAVDPSQRPRHRHLRRRLWALRQRELPLGRPDRFDRQPQRVDGSVHDRDRLSR